MLDFCIDAGRDTFVTDPVFLIYGWVGGCAPHAAADIRFQVNGVPQVFTVQERPDVKATGRYEFVLGFSLELDVVAALHATPGATTGTVTFTIAAGDRTLYESRHIVDPHLTMEREAAPVLFFIHIPKTAGTKIRSIIHRNYPKSRILPVYQSGVGINGTSLSMLSRTTLNRYDVVFGHYAHGLHQRFSRPALYATMLRDPVDLILSAYLFQRRTGARSHHISLEEYIARERFCDNPMTRYLGGCGMDKEMVEEADYEAALRHLRSFAFVGRQDRFAESMERFRTVLPLVAYEAHILENSTDRRDYESLRAMGNLDAVCDQIRARNIFDCRIWEAVDPSGNIACQFAPADAPKPHSEPAPQLAPQAEAHLTPMGFWESLLRTLSRLKH